MRLVLKNLKDTRELAQKLARKWLKMPGPLVIALYGNLGAGKTTFVQFFARALGIKEKVLSPSFLIIKSFVLPNQAGRFRFLVHIDCYRLKSAKDLVALGLKDILKGKDNIVVIEWPGKIVRYLPKNTTRICFKVVAEKERKVVIRNF